jgi:GDP-L-fucose synthase
MKKESKIYIAGHKGMVGSAIVRKLNDEGFNNLLTRSSKELDLCNQADVFNFFEKERPEYVFFAAGTVGGIGANKRYPADFIYNNLSMMLNTLNGARSFDVKKLLYLGSSCIYPKNSVQPIKEEYLLSGMLEESNKPYALAKIAGIELCQSFNRQYGTNYISLMPTNLFGINDNYDLQNSHLVPALIRKFYEATLNNEEFVELWGTGNPRREILSSDQAASACLYFMLNYNESEVVNIGVGVDYKISEIADLLRNISGFKGQIKYDTSKPDGTPKKQLDVDRARKLGWIANSDLIPDLTVTYNDFINNYSDYAK